MTPEIRDLTAMIEADSSDAWLYWERGCAYLDLGQTRRSVEDFDRAIALDDREPDFWLSRGRAYHRLGYLTEPRADYDRAIELDSTNALAYLGRGALNSDWHDYEAALRDFDRAILMEPDEAGFRARRAWTLMEMDELGRALVDIDEAIRLDPEYARFRFIRAQALLYFNPDVIPEAALPDLEEAIRLDPTASVFRESRGYIRFLQGRWAEAAEDLASLDIPHLDRCTPDRGADKVTWLYLARLLQGEEAAGLRAVRDFLSWYTAEANWGGGRLSLQEKLETWPVPVARFLAGEINGRELRETPPLVAEGPNVGIPEREEVDRCVREYHFVLGELAIARGCRDEGLDHLKAALGLPARNPKRWVAARQLASRT